MVESLASESELESRRVRPTSIRYLKCYYELLSMPQWQMAILGGFVCVLLHQFVPIVPFIFFGGFLAHLLESQVRSPGVAYPVFEFGRLSDYLSRGVWPFLIILPFLLFFFVLYVVTYFGGMIGLILATNNQDPEAIGLSFAIFLPTFVFGWCLAILLCQIMLAGMILRGTLMRSFREAFRFKWQLDFFRKTWFELIVSSLYLSITSQILTLIGALFFCIGSFVGSTWSMIAYTLMLAQLYRLYVARGGQPISLPETPESLPSQAH